MYCSVISRDGVMYVYVWICIMCIICLYCMVTHIARVRINQVRPPILLVVSYVCTVCMYNMYVSMYRHHFHSVIWAPTAVSLAIQLVVS